MNKPVVDHFVSRMQYGKMRKCAVYRGTDALRVFIASRIKKQSEEQDSVFMVSGLEGSGKSNFTLLCASLWSEITGREVPIHNITRHLKELFARIALLGKNNPSFLTLDEGAELAGDKTQFKNVKDTKDKFTAMRKRAHIVMVCFVNPLRITTYFREDRVRGLFFVVRPGVVYFYSNTSRNPHLINIIDGWSKEHEAKSIKFLLRYLPDRMFIDLPEFKGKLRDEYEARKDKNIDRVLAVGIDYEDPDIEIGIEQPSGVDGCKPDEWVPKSEVLKLLDNHIGSKNTLNKYIDSGLFRSKKFGGKIRVFKEDIDKYLAGERRVKDFAKGYPYKVSEVSTVND